MRYISYSEARHGLKSLLDQVVAEDVGYTVIVRRDAEDAVLMSMGQFNGLLETAHLLKSPENAAHLAKSIEQYRAGQTERHQLLDE